MERSTAVEPTGSPARRGLTLTEVMVVLLIFTAVMAVGMMLFRYSTGAMNVSASRRMLLVEANRLFSFMERRLPETMVNDRTGLYRMDFLGEEERMRFIAPYVEGDGSDLGRFGLYLDGETVMIAFLRVDAASPDFRFPAGFPGAQPLARGVTRMRCAYSDGVSWHDRWDSGPGSAQEGTLPRLVLVTADIASAGRREGRRESRSFERVFRTGGN